MSQPPFSDNPYADNPYSTPAVQDAWTKEQPVAIESGMITVYAALNLVWAGICLIWVGMIGAVLVFGIFFSGDPADEMAAGVLGSLILGAPGLLGLVVFLLAGIGLLRRTNWGYYAHITGAVLAVFSCVGLIYTPFALIHALQPGFRRAFP